MILAVIWGVRALRDASARGGGGKHCDSPMIFL